MKTHLKQIAFYVLLFVVIPCLFVLITGCMATKDSQVIEKITIFGLQAKTPGTQSGTAITVQLGLIRSSYVYNPVSTNQLYYAPFNSHVDANLSPINQHAIESMGTYELPKEVYNQATASTDLPTQSSVTATNK